LKVRRSRDLTVLGVAFIVLAADQMSKYWVRHNLMPGVPWDPVGWLRPILSLTYITNTGASFGLFPQLGGFYALITAAVIAAILFFYRRLPADGSVVFFSLGMQLGGALGNLFDRIWHGHVIDFVDLNFWPLHEWPIFNVSDSSVVVGACLLALYLLLEEGPATSTSGTDSAA